MTIIDTLGFMRCVGICDSCKAEYKILYKVYEDKKYKEVVRCHKKSCKKRIGYLYGKKVINMLDK